MDDHVHQRHPEGDAGCRSWRVPIIGRHPRAVLNVWLLGSQGKDLGSPPISTPSKIGRSGSRALDHRIKFWRNQWKGSFEQRLRDKDKLDKQ
nr:hypothetical protein CFP56_78409 [Quercus suber]